MKHTIRQHGQLTQIDCELGSGIRDKHGKEIFEGDIVKLGGTDRKIIVTKNNWHMLWFPNFEKNEIVGHVDD